MLQAFNSNQTGLVELSHHELREIHGGGPIVRFLMSYIADKTIGAVYNYLASFPKEAYTGPRPDPAHVADNTYVAHTYLP